MIAARRNQRWVLSLADLTLLLLGFFVMLHASQRGVGAAVADMRAYFGGAPMAAAPVLAADTLFEPGEAMLSDAGRKKIGTIVGKSPKNWEIASTGLSDGGQRMDSWELSAARLAAVARAVEAAGVPRDHIVLRGLDERAPGAKEGQRIALLAR